MYTDHHDGLSLDQVRHIGLAESLLHAAHCIKSPLAQQNGAATMSDHVTGARCHRTTPAF